MWDQPDTNKWMKPTLLEQLDKCPHSEYYTHFVMQSQILFVVSPNHRHHTRLAQTPCCCCDSVSSCCRRCRTSCGGSSPKRLARSHLKNNQQMIFRVATVGICTVSGTCCYHLMRMLQKVGNSPLLAGDICAGAILGCEVKLPQQPLILVVYVNETSGDV